MGLCDLSPAKLSVWLPMVYNIQRPEQAGPCMILGSLSAQCTAGQVHLGQNERLAIPRWALVSAFLLPKEPP